jgi:hypothetical protein
MSTMSREQFEKRVAMLRKYSPDLLEDAMGGFVSYDEYVRRETGKAILDFRRGEHLARKVYA